MLRHCPAKVGSQIGGIKMGRKGKVKDTLPNTMKVVFLDIIPYTKCICLIISTI